MLRKSLFALSLLAVPVTTVALASPTNAAVRPTYKYVLFKGSVTCHLTGVITSTPGLQLATAQTVTIKMSGNLTSCTGNISEGGATITKGHAFGEITGSYSCESLLSALPAPSGKLTWTVTPTNYRARPTKFTLSNATTSFPNISYTSTQTGSFAGTGAVKATIKQTETQLLTACSSSTGLTKINLSTGSVS